MRICKFCEKPVHARGVCKSHWDKGLGGPRIKRAYTSRELGVITDWVVEGKSNVWIAAQLGRTAASISNARNRYGIKEYTYINRKKVREAYGQDAQTVANNLGCSASSVRRIWRDMRLPALKLFHDKEGWKIRQHVSQIRRRRLEGKAAGFDPDLIRELFEDGYSDKEAAEELGCSPVAFKLRRLQLGLKRMRGGTGSVKHVYDKLADVPG